MPLVAGVWRLLAADPRHGQIATLATLLIFGLTRLDFDLTVEQAMITVGTALAVQAIADWYTGRSIASGAKSALISALSLCLLLRTDSLVLAAAASVVAVGSKFVIRVRGKHVFNPTNGGLVAMVLLTDQVWVSSGQWGSAASFAFLMACLGGLVVNRAARSEPTASARCRLTEACVSLMV